MPDDPQDESSESDSSVIQEMRKQLKELQKQNKELSGVAAENARLKRDMLFDEAGVGRDGAAKYFRQSFQAPEGEELTVELIRQQAKTDGLLAEAAKPAAAPQESQLQMTEQQRLAQQQLAEEAEMERADGVFSSISAVASPEAPAAAADDER